MKYARVHATRKDFVLDVGSGGFPHSTADILVDKYLEDVLEHRSGNVLKLDRPFVQADIIELPFKDKAFDYVIANQIIEHIPEPTRALDEIARVGRRGYISVPSEFQEIICSHSMHLWVFAKQGNELLIKKKQAHHSYGTANLYGGVFWWLHEDPRYKRFMLEHSNLFWVNFEWKDVIHYRAVSPDYPFYNYKDRVSVASLLELTPPENFLEYAKWQFRINLDQISIYRFARLRTFLRDIAKRI